MGWWIALIIAMTAFELYIIRMKPNEKAIITKQRVVVIGLGLISISLGIYMFRFPYFSIADWIMHALHYSF